MNDLIRDLVPDDMSILNLKYWCNSGFKQFFRMSPTKLEELLVKIEHSINENNTNFRKAIPAQNRFAMTTVSCNG